MFKTKRKRAVVLALIAFFCTAATTYVAVDWKRFGGGFLAILRGKGQPAVASGGTGTSGASGGSPAGGESGHPYSPPLVLAAAGTRKHGASHGAGGGGQPDEDLFKYGDPAAGIPAGSFIVAQNDTQGGARGDGVAQTSASPEVTTPAPTPTEATPFGAPGPSNGALNTAGLHPGGNTGNDTPPPPANNPPPPPPADGTPPAAPLPGGPIASPPAGTPIQDGNSTGGDTPNPPGSPLPPIPPTAPVSSVPEASNTAMMTLGLLFAAAAATRSRRQNG